MIFKPLKITGVILIEPDIFADKRGFFMETYNQRTFNSAGINTRFVQDNHSLSVCNTLRGLHYQIKQPQGKLLRVVRGEIFDVAVDLRRTSPTFGLWVAEYLSADTHRLLWIPPGFAHGFYVLSEEAEFIYKCTDFYAPEYERSLCWDDPMLAIDWPIVGQDIPILSDKDRYAPKLHDAECFD